MIVKWKFRECKPSVKGKTIDGYINYIEKQVKERRNELGIYANAEEVNNIGSNKGDAKRIKDMESADFEQANYLEYINSRKGSSLCFSYDNADLSLLKAQLKEHIGGVWIPIVSEKEADAIKYGLDTEAKWIAKGRELAEEYRKILGINKENYRWIAAFHSKPEDLQNIDSDAKSQPHLHFMIWEETPLRQKYALTEDEINKVRQRTYNIMLRDYMQKFYNERNALREELLHKSLSDFDLFEEDVKKLIFDVHAITDGKGRFNVAELEKREDLSGRIADKLFYEQKLTDMELYYKVKLGIKNHTDAIRSIANHSSVLSSLDNLTTKSISMNQELYENWLDITKKMREGYVGDNNKAAVDDLNEIRKRIKNGILKEIKQADNPRISNEMKGKLLEKLEKGHLKQNISLDNLKTTVEVIAQLQKAIGVSKEEAKKQQDELAERSQKEELQDYIEQVIEDVYASMQYGFPITSNDYYFALKMIGIPPTRSDLVLGVYDGNPYKVTNNILLEPMVQHTKTVLNEKAWTVLDISSKSLLEKSLEEISFIPTSAEEYSKKYNSMINMYSLINQKDFDDDDELIR